MGKQKLFSIVTVAYNAESLIEGTMMSIFNQTFTDYEYIVIDGNSSDATMKIISQYSKRIDIVVSEPDKGIYDAMNKAIVLASGEYVIFMNCGDWFYSSTVLERVSKSIVLHDSDVIYGNTVIDTVVGKYIVYPQRLDKEIRKRMPFCHQSSFLKTNVAKKYLFDLSFKEVADYDMFMRIYNDGYSFDYINEIIAIYEMRDTDGIHSYKRTLEAANVSHNIFVYCIAYKRLTGTYVRKLFPDCVYKTYRRLKYAFKSNYKYID